MTTAQLETFVDWGQHTVVVDPIHRDYWIYDGSNAHERSQVRGMAEDVKAIRRASNWERADQNPLSMYLPTTREIDVLDRFTCRGTENERSGKTHHDARPSNGQLPVISDFMYSGSLQNKSKGVIEHEIREANRYAGNRLFDTSGYTR